MITLKVKLKKLFFFYGAVGIEKNQWKVSCIGFPSDI